MPSLPSSSLPYGHLPAGAGVPCACSLPETCVPHDDGQVQGGAWWRDRHGAPVPPPSEHEHIRRRDVIPMPYEYLPSSKGRRI